MYDSRRWFPALLGGALVAALGGCGQPSGGVDSQRRVIRVEGSDTMVNLAQAWAEEYKKIRPDVSVQISGGGSGVGIASLVDGVADMANTSRRMRPREIARAEYNMGRTPVEHVLGLDALAIYVHRSNPIETISLEELADIYADDGEIVRWSQLGVRNPGCRTDEIIRISRQSNSGTYHYFRDAILNDRDFKLGSIDQSGSKDVVALVSRTPCSIGYSGMGYATDDVKWLKVAVEKGQEGVAPSVESLTDGSYPISRPLLIYTLGEPTGTLKEFFDWIYSEVGQQIVLDLGYVPIALPGADSAETAESGAADADGAGTDSDEPSDDKE
jgi:phosphate transport system substrate-binding protein